MANGLRTRIGVHNLTDQQVSGFRDAYQQMMQISDNRGYAYFAGLHGVPNWFCWHHQQNNHIASKMQLFLPWHRACLYNLEMAMRDRVPDVTLPWWDWTLRSPRQTPIPQIFDAPLIGTAANPLHDFRIQLSVPTPIDRDTIRQPGGEDGLPAEADIDSVVSETDWDSFTSALEDVHDKVHMWVGGDMGRLSFAAYDPIFWSHHAMIDRLWWLWQVKNGNSNISPDLLDQVLAPFNMTVRDVLNVNDLGYDYAAAQMTVPVGSAS